MPCVRTIITTVTTPAASYALTDRATVKTLLNINGKQNDDFLDLVIARASAAAANYCNRVFPVESVQDSFLSSHWLYYDRANGVAPLQLSRWPLTAITSVTEDGTALVENTDYLRNAATGQLTRKGLSGYATPWLRAEIVVQYSAGYAPIPADLADAVERMVKSAWFARNRDPMLRSQNSEGIYSAQYWFGSGPGNSGGIAPDIADLLDNYRVPLVG